MRTPWKSATVEMQIYVFTIADIHLHIQCTVYNPYTIRATMLYLFLMDKIFLIHSRLYPSYNNVPLYRPLLTPCQWSTWEDDKATTAKDLRLLPFVGRKAGKRIVVATGLFVAYHLYRPWMSRPHMSQRSIIAHITADRSWTSDWRIRVSVFSDII